MILHFWISSSESALDWKQTKWCSETAGEQIYNNNSIRSSMVASSTDRLSRISRYNLPKNITCPCLSKPISDTTPAGQPRIRSCPSAADTTSGLLKSQQKAQWPLQLEVLALEKAASAFASCPMDNMLSSLLVNFALHFATRRVVDNWQQRLLSAGVRKWAGGFCVSARIPLLLAGVFFKEFQIKLKFDDNEHLESGKRQSRRFACGRDLCCHHISNIHHPHFPDIVVAFSRPTMTDKKGRDRIDDSRCWYSPSMELITIISLLTKPFSNCLDTKSSVSMRSMDFSRTRVL